MFFNGKKCNVLDCFIIKGGFIGKLIFRALVLKSLHFPSYQSEFGKHRIDK